MEILAQILGLLATGFILVAYQFRANRTLFILQMISAAFFALNMLLLGAYGGFVLNLLAALRGVILSLPKGKGITKPMFWAVIAATVVGYGILYWQGLMPRWIDFLLPLQFMVGTAFCWKQDGRALRMAQLAVMSPVCLVYNCTVFSLGGILTECFNMVSIVVSLIRFGWHGFETANTEKENENV